MSIVSRRRCCACGILKPASEFHQRALSPGGLASRCKVCRSVAPAHPAGTKFCRVCWVRKPLFEFSENRRRKDGRTAKCRPCDRAYKQRWVADHAAEHRDRNRQWNAANIEYHRAYRAERADKFREVKRQWAARNPEVVRAALERSRARKAAAEGTYTVGEWLALCAAYQYRCLACGQQGRLTVDHVVPLSAGGSNRIDNLQPLCKPCNSSKGDKTIDYR